MKKLFLILLAAAVAVGIWCYINNPSVLPQQVILLLDQAKDFLTNLGGKVTTKVNTALGVYPDVLLVNAEHPLPAGYTCERVNCYEQKGRHFLLANSGIELEKQTYAAANAMFLAAENEGMNGFILTSGYRDAEEQERLYREQGSDTAQKPGCSEHQTGLAFDVTTRYDSGSFADTPQYAWLIRNCWSYGFILRYPEGKENLTGIAAESWHYRYVGNEAAAIIREHNWTLEEYVAAAQTH